MVYPFNSLPSTHIIFAISAGVLAVYLKDKSIVVLTTLFVAFLLWLSVDQSIDSAKILAPSATDFIGFMLISEGNDSSNATLSLNGL